MFLTKRSRKSFSLGGALEPGATWSSRSKTTTRLRCGHYPGVSSLLVITAVQWLLLHCLPAKSAPAEADLQHRYEHDAQLDEVLSLVGRSPSVPQDWIFPNLQQALAFASDFQPTRTLLSCTVSVLRLVLCHRPTFKLVPCCEMKHQNQLMRVSTCHFAIKSNPDPTRSFPTASHLTSLWCG